MVALLVLVVSLLLLRGIGAAGVAVLNSWQNAALGALSVLFVFTGVAHFNRMRHDLVKMVPGFIPNPMAFIYFTGICEILGAIGLLIPQVRQTAGIALILFLIVVLPANLKAAREKLALSGRPATPLWLRIPMQALFIGLLWWTTQTSW